jgi:hypothetical protein
MTKRICTASQNRLDSGSKSLKLDRIKGMRYPLVFGVAGTSSLWP